MPNITRAALVLSMCKLGFSISSLAYGKLSLELSAEELQTLAFLTLVFGNQAVLLVLRERGHLWGSIPSTWVLASSVVDIVIVSALALTGTLMAPLPLQLLLALLVATLAFALILDQIKLPTMRLFKVQ